MKRVVAMTAAACLAAASCAELHKPGVDLGGADQAKYEADLAGCRDEAKLAVDEGTAVLVGAILLAYLGSRSGIAPMPTGTTGTAREQVTTGPPSAPA